MVSVPTQSVHILARAQMVTLSALIMGVTTEMEDGVRMATGVNAQLLVELREYKWLCVFVITQPLSVSDCHVLEVCPKRDLATFFW